MAEYEMNFNCWLVFDFQAGWLHFHLPAPLLAFTFTCFSAISCSRTVSTRTSYGGEIEEILSLLIASQPPAHASIPYHVAGLK